MGSIGRNASSSPLGCIVMQFKNDKLVLLCAFRYALGRATYMPSLIAEELERNWQEFEPWQREQILGDIDHAVKHDMAGMDCDKKMWSSFASRVSV